MTSSNYPPIRFGVMCFNTTFPAWQAYCIKKLLELPNVELSLFIIDKGSTDFYSFANRFKRIRWNQLFFQLFNNFWAKPKASMPVDLSEELKDVSSLPCRIIKKGKFSQYFRDEDIEAIRQHNLDFILRFAFGIIRGDVLKSARYGVWSFHHDDEEKYRGGPPCFWEIYHNDPVTATILQRLTNRLDGGVVLKKGFFPTNLTSYKRNLNQAFYESALWPSQVCIDIRNGITDSIEAAPSKTDAPIFYSPTNLQMLVYVSKIIKHTMRQVFTSLFRHNHWNIGVAQQPIQDYITSDKSPEIKWLPSPDSHEFYADPFAIKKDGITTILFEQLDYRIDKGRLFCVQFKDDPSSIQPKPVLESEFHRSYPFLLEYEDDIYCIPETYESGEIVLYKATNFPFEWEKCAVLVEQFQGVDATLFQLKERWWLAATNQEDGPCHKLWLWYADSPFGLFTPHANNPVKTDIRSSRPAGTPFVHEGQLYRPAQDCSSAYGGRVVINRIQECSAVKFCEEEAAVVKPDHASPYPDGCHTLSGFHNLTVVDGRNVKFIPSAFVQTIKRGFTKLLKR